MTESEHTTDPKTASSAKALRPDDAIVKAARALRKAKPQLDKLIIRATPGAKVAGRSALRYVQEHEAEIKQAAATFARYRLRGPLRLVAEAFAGVQSNPKLVRELKCDVCGTLNAGAAKFCNQCGNRLTAGS